ncbi:MULTISPECIES: response regulator transcription factor [Fusobacterium]|jgi:two-component system copper resistance phosphate regulon response regulator CusR|uniref:DNA-binding response regulator n=2 Tax=Fusobacterium varium TaxID=856 RepID=A0ABM6U7Y7_FUSVA|nr:MULTISPECIES: response regulator transcription factor [Fusobacterium]AVQ32474.1 DNA-binding response regulator [Fusobacterium varium ATCC 27725]EES64415.1 putative transcriptional regulatory protein CusR [Fusobacterium varium ATCC 27725]MCF0169884.1 response regulator transcription factor [Fusobacterium varium]MCF2673735.1 response regulator transcription factor [Fusobacterium varium]MCI6032527.1 response regulator transcription factor [Fusobacterium varium]
MNILIAQKDMEIKKYLKKGLKEAGYSVEESSDWEDTYYHAISGNYELVILDSIIEDKSGIELCGKIRKENTESGIIFISSEDRVEKKVEAFDAGADDYVTKPFSFIELLGRIRAIIRRTIKTSVVGNNIITIKDLSINFLTREVRRGNKIIELTYKEFSLLEYLVRNKNLVLSRTMIKEKIWSINFTSNTNIVDVYMTHLRSKIDKNHKEKLIYTVRGVGYILKG